MTIDYLSHEKFFNDHSMIPGTSQMMVGARMKRIPGLCQDIHIGTLNIWSSLPFLEIKRNF